MEEVVRQLMARALSGGRTEAAALWLRPARSLPDLTAAQWRRMGWIAAVGVLALAGLEEIRTSRLQATLLAAMARQASYELAPGTSHAVDFPRHGPLDTRYGYTRLPRFVNQLLAGGFVTTAQARWSRVLMAMGRLGVSPPYHPKAPAGLVLLDRRSNTLYDARQPQRVYRTFEEIPPVVVGTLLFIENRELLDERSPYDNPAIEVDRLVKAVVDTSLHHLTGARAVSGGSTLAVQLQKTRHSPDGRTGSVTEKGRQLLSASLLAYLDGPDTRHTRQRLVTDYVNGVPLGAVAGVGEVFGLGDGLVYWFGADFDRMNRLLRTAGDPDADRRAVATAYRQALMLLAAVKRPTAYLMRDASALDRRVDAYLPALANARVIPAWLGDAARQVRVTPGASPPPARRSFVEHKATDAIRIELGTTLGISLHDLDRLDAEVHTPVDAAVTGAVTAVLGRLSSCHDAARAGLVGPRLLPGSACDRVVYSFTLYERDAPGNRLRVQTDTSDRPLNLNEGSRLELGSTAKLRTLVTYLELVAALHRRYGAMPADALRLEARSAHDALTRWALAYLANAPARRLDAMLEAAMTRRYSASPAEVFFTGGGLHAFSNFDPDDDGRVLSVREGFQRSVNLVFIRLMRDIAEHLGDPEAAAILHDRRHPARLPVLQRFVELERARSAGTRDDTWLLTTHRKEAQDRAIRIVLERDAFARLHARWRALGYPFATLVPSLATAVGSSGDNPWALSRLLGIIINDGMDMPFIRIESIRFGAGTPYDTTLERHTRGERVLDPAVASLLRQELLNVVANGTGRRLAGGITVAPGVTWPIGGKTGTGDNRFWRGARSRVVNRTAALAFTIGDRFFGTIVAYVPGPAAGDYRFTSALPVQVLKHLLPVLQPLFRDGRR